MKKMIPFIYMICALLLLAVITGCGSTGSSGTSYNTSYHHNSWDYDNDYRSNVNDHYNRSAVKAHALSERGARSGGGRGGGGGRR